MTVTTYEDLRADLRTGILEIRFIKQDGTVRLIRATQDANMVPPAQHAQLHEARVKPIGDAITVWDFNMKAWRTVRIDSIQTVQRLDNF